ncbi:hypothetical protein [Paenibacillus kyungheensis]
MKISKFLIVTALSALLFNNCFVENSNAQSLSESKEQTKNYNNLIDQGLTNEEATKIITYEKIKEDMDDNGLVASIDNQGEVVVKNTVQKGITENNDEDSLSSEDLDFLQQEYDQNKDKKKLSNSERIKVFNEYIKEHPETTNKRLNFDDGTWVEFEAEQERVDNISDENVSTFDDVPSIPNAVRMEQKPWPSAGVYKGTATVKLNDGATFARIFVTQTTTVKGDSPSRVVSYKTEESTFGRDSTGLAEVGDATRIQTRTQTRQDTTPYLWTQNAVKATFKYTGNGSLNLGSVISFSISGNKTWEQYAAISGSLAYSSYWAGSNY